MLELYLVSMMTTKPKNVLSPTPKQCVCNTIPHTHSTAMLSHIVSQSRKGGDMESQNCFVFSY